MKASLRRTWRLWQWTLSQALHQRVAWALAAVAFGIVAGGSVLRVFNFGDEEPRFFLNLAQASLLGSGTLLAAVLGPLLFCEGLASRTTHLFLTRGARRGEIVSGAVLAMVTLLGWLVLLHAVALSFLMLSHGHGAGLSISLRLLAAGFGPLLIIGSMAVLMPILLHRPALATLGTLALTVAGQLAPVLQHMQTRSEGFVAWLWSGLAYVVPNFAIFETAPASIAALYAGGYAALYWALAVLCFARREI